MVVAMCQHVKIDRAQCGSPAMRGQHYCYFHAGAHRTIPSVNLWASPQARTLRQNIISPRRHGEHGVFCNELRRDDAIFVGLGWLKDRWSSRGWDIELPDAAAIQIGFMRVFWGLMQGMLNARQAKLFLRAVRGGGRHQRSRD